MKFLITSVSFYVTYCLISIPFMKTAAIILLISICLCNCNDKKKAINFASLNDTEFNSNPFKIREDQIPASLKRAHDSCMGFSFKANAFFLQTRDRYLIGNIVNRRSLQV